MAKPDVAAAATPWTAAMRASLDRLINFGRAVAARMPSMTMTTTSSIRVKPLCFACICFSYSSIETVCKSARLPETSALNRSATSRDHAYDWRSVADVRRLIAHAAIRHRPAVDVHGQCIACCGPARRDDDVFRQIRNLQGGLNAGGVGGGGAA